MSSPKPQEQPQLAMFQIISGFWVSRAVFIIAKLGIPDLLKAGPKTAEVLAFETETDAPSLFRVLRALASVGVAHDRSFDKTAMGLTCFDSISSVAPGRIWHM